MDRDIAGGLENIPVAEKIVGHKWDSMLTDFNKMLFKNKEKHAEKCKKLGMSFYP